MVVLFMNPANGSYVIPAGWFCFRSPSLIAEPYSLTPRTWHLTPAPPLSAFLLFFFS
jgi:hypothetical protein